ncbi:uncharacterized protein I303_101653 [Kwoniella dejecticola CBS 10117]|uniref:Carboxypeptidase D n=1 Tax=Kwoniella dejecticola CBS 10117 TaxID=1296121 RepID=A0A1A6AD63_9TREE|nr:uncharacterized protein I303_02210 [Kwoniella dejecticola CBS 10117]OBR87994.1 hypothetical protein I303_02210 [Kwoniella dejecticola CBS 10117]
MASQPQTKPKGFKYVIEHMEEDDENTKALPEWVKLEYSHMLKLVGPQSTVHFTSLSASSIPPLISHLSAPSPVSSSGDPTIHLESTSKGHPTSLPILELLKSSSSSSSSSSSAEDREDRKAIPKERVCLLDPKAEKILSPEDADTFDVFLYGGILGDDPPRDRTKELRKLGFEGRHLGEKQMTTDTAVGVTKIVVEDQISLDKIPFTDFPTITFNKYESIEMPFRYVVDDKGEPILPPGMREHLKADLNRSIEDF